MTRKWSVLISLLFISLFAAGCAPFLDRGMQDTDITADDVPQEPSREELESKIKSNTSKEIDDIIQANFTLLDVVAGEGNREANIYATTAFTLPQLESALTAAMEPEKRSEVKDNRQILIYPEHFVTLRVSEDDKDVLLIEVADDEFVRRNYSPNFLTTYFAIRLLDDVLDVDDWGKRRTRECRTGNCYGGYTSKMYGAPGRGNTSFRGGGPGAGK
ncbi:DUF4247 domain-containing protein [Virgibacillus kekensis]|uniref:DUF4247 domain-containing protein n=1 Tax=Virgibacillus kekensis TaxID=202261 RepID=A0ABV9DE65_9BACI